MSFIAGREDEGEHRLSKEQIVGEALALRAKIKSNATLRVQMLAAISEALGKSGIRLDDEVLSTLTIAVQEELEDVLPNAVTLPGGTNCAT